MSDDEALVQLTNTGKKRKGGEKRSTSNSSQPTKWARGVQKGMPCKFPP